MEELVRRAATGDTRAFEALMRETTTSVNTVVRSYVKHPEDVRDVVQEVYLRALQRLGDLEDPSRFRPWLYQIARNAGLDHLRRVRRRPADSLDASDYLDPMAIEPSPSELAEVADLARRVQVGMAQLGPRDATLLAMITTLGFTPTDVANALGMTPTAAKVAVHRARNRLRNAMLLSTTLTATEASARPGGCAEFDALVDAGDLVGAAVHARGCSTCGRTKRAARSLVAKG